jgi:hypothetical protein
MAGWLKHRAPKRRFSPKDGLVYVICEEVIDFTIRILKEYGAEKPAAEGVVYWAGRLHENEWHVCAAVAPAVQASRYGFQTGYDTNGRFVSFLCDNELRYVSQVHSHPSTYVNHSPVDDEETAFRREGLLSIVVPDFGRNGLLPWKQCGVNIYTKGIFKRITDKHLIKHFQVERCPTDEIMLKDFRND